MTSTKRLNRRWAVPALAIALIGAGSAAPSLIGSADASPPVLPPLTAAELLAKARTAQVTALSGTVQLTANLGLPSLDSLGSLGGGGSTSSLTSLLTGQHSAKVWMDGTDHVRIATVAPMAETNWIRNGADLWSYDSSTLTTTHATVPTHTADSGDAADEGSGSGVPMPDSAHDTPIEFAQELLDNVTPSTSVTVDSTARVAGRPAYQLVLTPLAEASTVQDVTLAIDAATGLPLDVRIDAKVGGTALELGFTDISFDTPDASTFDFTPPPDSTVVEATSPAGLLGTGGEFHRHHRRDGSGSFAGPTAGNPFGDVQMLGEDWSSVAVVANSKIPAQLDSFLDNAEQITVGTETARLVTTNLVNVLVFADGRIAIGAVTPDALAAAVVAG